VAEEPPASAAVIADCQADVTAAIAGKEIQFDSGAATIKPESTALIDAVGKALAPCAGTRIEVAGHTDATGRPDRNMILSEARAAAVVAALGERGVPAERLVAKGYGSSKPRQPGSDAAANAANRRIEFAVAANDASPRP
jgi:OOP family OmpA-OmpF porin